MRTILQRVAQAALAIGVLSGIASAQAIRPGFNTTNDGRNDDGTYTAPSGCTNLSSGGTCPGTPVSIGFDGNFFGTPFNSLFLNTNGNAGITAKNPVDELRTPNKRRLLRSSHQCADPEFAATRGPSGPRVTCAWFSARCPTTPGRLRDGRCPTTPGRWRDGHCPTTPGRWRDDHCCFPAALTHSRRRARRTRTPLSLPSPVR